MRNSYRTLIVAIVISYNVFANGDKDKQILTTKEQVRINESLHHQGLLFTPNKGQIADSAGNPSSYILFKAESPNLNIWVTTTGLTYQFFKIEGEQEKENRNSESEMMPQNKDEKVKIEWYRVDMVLKGASIQKENIITEGNITQGDKRYYLGHCPDGIFNVKTYTKITIKEVYKGIDWVLYTSKEGGIKHDFIVQPNADPNQIKLIYEGNGKINVEDNKIYFKNELGEIKEGNLICYQGIESNTIKSNYIIKKNTSLLYLGAGNLPTEGKNFPIIEGLGEVFSYEIGINLNSYDKTNLLVIDPQLVWATFYGGNSLDGPMSADTDGSGNLFVTGYVSSINFPVQNAGTFFQGVQTGGAGGDCFILKFNNNGALLWATYYGGTNGGSQANSIATDAGGNIFVTGFTTATDFPVCNGVGCCTTCPSGYFQGTNAGGSKAFILKFDNAGNRLWATYYGGTNGGSLAKSIATDANGNVFVTGYTLATDFPVLNTGTFFQGALAGGVSDAFILKFGNNGTLLWATYYGGSLGTDEEGLAIATDAIGNVFVTGQTTSPNFPVCNTCPGYFDGIFDGLRDAFILKFDNNGNRLWATYYGGSVSEWGSSIATDIGGNVFVTGYTNSANLPVCNACQGYFDGTLGGADIFILKFDNGNNRLWATFYGGSGTDRMDTYDNIAIDHCGKVYISFNTRSTNLPVQSTCDLGYQKNGFPLGEPDYIDNALVLFDNKGNRLWATYFGGSSTSDYREVLAIDNKDDVFMAGEWINSIAATYPLTNPGGGTYFDNTPNGSDDGYIAKFVHVPANISKSQINATNCTCNGSATVTLNCGTPDYSYVWSNGSSTINTTVTTNTITGLCPGNYTVTATSNCNQTQTATFVIAGGSGSISAGITGTTTICNGSTTTLTANGGVTYTWSNGYAGQTATGLSAGNYIVTVTDAGGCTATTSVTVISTPPLIGQFTKGSANCTGCGCKEWLMVNATGGTSPYSYTWPDGYDKRYKNQLCPGNYTINIKDKNGCSVNVSLTAP